MVKDCTACLVSGKTGPPPGLPLQTLQWPAGPRENIQMFICVELPGVLHHQRFLIMDYDLYSKWPETVSTRSMTCWGLPTAITTDNGHNSSLQSSNGGVELMNQMLKNSVRAVMTEEFQFSAALLRTLLHDTLSTLHLVGYGPMYLLSCTCALSRIGFFRSFTN